MKLTVKDTRAKPGRCDLLVVLGLEGQARGKSKKPVPRIVVPAGVVVPELALEAFRGEFRETRLTDAVGGSAARLLQVGLGKRADVTPERLRRAAALALKKAEKVRAADVVLWIDDEVTSAAGGAEAAAQALAEGARMATYSLSRFKRKPKAPWVKTVALHGGGAAFARGARKGDALGKANLFARELQDTPANLMRPRDLVAAARTLAKSPRITLRTVDEAGLKRLGMGSFLSVSRGSAEPGYLIHLVHRPRARAKAKLCVVGKGLTFDAGGISLKPAAKMDEMKYDMSGGAAVLGLFHALAALELPLEVHGLVGACENLPDGAANKPGDLVVAMNGLSIEVLNTDAEGRLVLADALCYAEKKIKPAAIVDLATLTGAVVVALGHELTGTIGSDQALVEELVACGLDTGERCWPLPLLDNFKEHVKGSVGDLRNINAGQGAGSSAAAAFLSNFVEKTPWVHLDIAGTAWGTDDRDYQGGSRGTGVGVRLLYRWLERRAGKG
jgi:leucyl aminopeptidase